MEHNVIAPPPFLNCITKSYLSLLSRDKQIQIIDDFIETIICGDVNKTTAKRIISTLLDCIKNSPLQELYYDDLIKTLKMVEADTKAVRESISRMAPISGEKILSEIKKLSPQAQFDYVTNLLATMNSLDLELYLSFCIGHVITLFQKKILTKDDIKSFWETIHNSVNASDVKEILCDVYNIRCDALHDEEMVDIISSNTDEQKDILSDWQFFLDTYQASLTE